MQATVQNLPSILTLEEAADYLRLSPDIVLQEAIAGKIPGQPIGDHWRFLRSAIDEWLHGRDSRTILLQQAGAFSDDETLAEIQAQIDRDRQQFTLESHD
jgi:excisionase family DNA binding protein